MKVMVKYDHDSTDFHTIELAMGDRDTVEPLEGWIAAYRDTVDGVRCVWARFDQVSRYVWLRDGQGARRVTVMT